MLEEHMNQFPHDVVSRHLHFLRDQSVVGMRDEFEIDRVNWHPVAGGDDADNGIAAREAGVTDPGYNDVFDSTVKIRYNHPGTRATVTRLENNRARIQLHEPQRAVTPGQAAVIYDEDVVLGGGWICRSAATCHAERSEAKSKDPAMVP